MRADHDFQVVRAEVSARAQYLQVNQQLPALALALRDDVAHYDRDAELEEHILVQVSAAVPALAQELVLLEAAALVLEPALALFVDFDVAHYDRDAELEEHRVSAAVSEQVRQAALVLVAQ